MIDAGSTVVASYLQGARHEEFVIANVQPGDDLVFGDDPDPAPAGTFDVTFPPFADGYGYTVWGPCGPAPAVAPGDIAKIPFYDGCKPDTFDVFVVAEMGGIVRLLKTTNVQRAAGFVRVQHRLARPGPRRATRRATCRPGPRSTSTATRRARRSVS